MLAASLHCKYATYPSQQNLLCSPRCQCKLLWTLPCKRLTLQVCHKVDILQLAEWLQCKLIKHVESMRAIQVKYVCSLVAVHKLGKAYFGNFNPLLIQEPVSYICAIFSADRKK